MDDLVKLIVISFTISSSDKAFIGIKLNGKFLVFAAEDKIILVALLLRRSASFLYPTDHIAEIKNSKRE